MFELFGMTNLDVELSELALLLKNNNSKFILIGSGKNYHIATLVTKVANSYGLKWFSLDAGQALHGDIGIVNKKDIICYVSKSGNTQEIFDCAVYLKDILSVSVTYNPDCLIKKFCKLNIFLPIEKEYSVFEKAPMYSSIVTIIFFYKLINVISKDKTPNEYFVNHPSGQIGMSIGIDK